MDKTKEIILATSQKLFSRFGLDKTAVDEIAKFAHVAKGTIYNYFKSKINIFEEVVKSERQVLQHEIKVKIDAVNTPQEKLRAFVLTRFKVREKLINYYNALTDEYLRQYPFIEEIRKNDFENDIKMVSEILEEGLKKGAFIIQNVHLTAIAIITAIRGLEYPWDLDEPLQDIEKNADGLLNLLFKGIEAS
ncbi:MAG TPA: TetR family transcriptional regulator [Bacteroidetes bacterium]|nr:TetR family transcriptional regulator [Bacteroidota bacterium]